MQFSSKLLERAVSEFSKLPGIGSKTALRLVLHLLNQKKEDVFVFGNTVIDLRDNICFCSECGNISDNSICEICANEKRDKSFVCIVEDSRDVIAIENTGEFKGVYHVLNGLISPMDGVGPSDLNIASLIQRMSKGEIKEVLMALNPTMEGDTTMFYIYKKIKEYPVKVTSIARGISFGGEIEYVDDITLARSIATRVVYEK